MKHSCGAILYAVHPVTKAIGIILGYEGNAWMPFKGCQKPNETYEAAAIREIYEETCGYVRLPGIELEHEFCTKRKIYHIGLARVDYKFINAFRTIRPLANQKEFMEKKAVRFFPVHEIDTQTDMHDITRRIIDFFKPKLQKYQEIILARHARFARYIHAQQDNLVNTANQTSLAGHYSNSNMSNIIGDMRAIAI